MMTSEKRAKLEKHRLYLGKQLAIINLRRADTTDPFYVKQFACNQNQTIAGWLPVVQRRRKRQEKLVWRIKRMNKLLATETL